MRIERNLAPEKLRCLALNAPETSNQHQVKPSTARYILVKPTQKSSHVKNAAALYQESPPSKITANISVAKQQLQLLQKQTEKHDTNAQKLCQQQT